MMTISTAMESREPVVLQRAEHPISRSKIDPDALKVLYRLYRNGFTAYLVGGAVRDILLGKKPKDFDVVTDARPAQVKKLFGNCMLIGRRFRLAHIRFKGGKIIEVATFRKEPQETDGSEEAVDPNTSFGTPQEDAFRRDLTINALFYDISSFTIIDYVGGLEDLRTGTVRMIGDPRERYVEDPVRMWRVLRHAARLGFSIEEKTAREIEQNRGLLCACSGARLYEELNKDIDSGFFYAVLRLFRDYGVLPCLIGKVGSFLQETPGAFDALGALVGAADDRARSGKPLSREAVLSLMLWPWADHLLKDRQAAGDDKIKVLHDALFDAGMSVTIPKTVKANIIQILYIVERMRAAMESGRMKWSLRKRSRYPEASMVFSIVSGRGVVDPQDPFAKIFREAHPEARVLRGRKRRPSRRRRGRGKAAPGTP
jgi:poly(A) polymerase